jgi:hypothetical protein
MRSIQSISRGYLATSVMFHRVRQLAKLATAIIVASTAAVAGCGMSDDPDDISFDTSELTLDTTSSANRLRQCEGYTSGGGQRVRGKVGLGTDAANGLYYHYLTVQAENWKKNIGWNTKPTGQLRIEGTVYVSTPSAPTESYSVYVDTGGETVRRIGQEVWRSAGTVNAYATAEVYLTFHGRDGTHCAIE